jgi:hypothetical protein
MQVSDHYLLRFVVIKYGTIRVVLSSILGLIIYFLFQLNIVSFESYLLRIVCIYM